jgi:hypothetical protein
MLRGKKLSVTAANKISIIKLNFICTVKPQMVVCLHIGVVILFRISSHISLLLCIKCKGKIVTVLN